MYKDELTKKMAKDAGISQAAAERALKSFTETVTNALADGDKVVLVGFGTFEARARAARMGNNPQTKEKIEIPATIAPIFKAGKGFKTAIAGK